MLPLCEQYAKPYPFILLVTPFSTRCGLPSAEFWTNWKPALFLPFLKTKASIHTIPYFWFAINAIVSVRKQLNIFVTSSFHKSKKMQSQKFGFLFPSRQIFVIHFFPIRPKFRPTGNSVLEEVALCRHPTMPSRSPKTRLAAAGPGFLFAIF